MAGALIVASSTGIGEYFIPGTVQRFDDGRVGVQFQTDGDIFSQSTATQPENLTDSGADWVEPKGYSATDHWIRFTVVSGDTPSGSATGSWLKLSGSGSADRHWYLLGVTGNSVATSWTIEIALDSGGSNVVASKSASWTVDDSP